MRDFIYEGYDVGGDGSSRCIEHMHKYKQGYGYTTGRLKVANLMEKLVRASTKANDVENRAGEEQQPGKYGAFKIR